MPDEVIELSVEETNALRAELGLAPLRTGKSSEEVPIQDAVRSSSDQQEVLEMSVNETNDLRRELGLAPLRVTEGAEDGTSSRHALHKPADNVGDTQKIAERMERSKLEREVQKGIASTFSQAPLTEEASDSAQSWAAKMRMERKKESKKTSKKKKKKGASLEATYNERDLEGLNVSHGMSELEAGSTTIMTLADAPLLKTQDEHSSKVIGLNEDSQTLQNVELTERQIQQDGLRKKRQAELGMGRAGGYAGFDDDEFEELGGTQGPSQLTRGQAMGGPPTGNGKKQRGFKIGAAVSEEKDNQNDLFAFKDGKAISLVPTQADVTASDFMTVEEDSLLNKPKKKKKKDTKFKKKKKKDKRHRRKEQGESDDEAPTKGLLETLEETAVGTIAAGQKRRRTNSEDKEKYETTEATPMEIDDDAKKRAKYDQIMAKGNVRTAEAFKENTPEPDKAIVEEEPDDAFLNAALAKARRLRRLKEMSNGGSKPADRGADAVARAVENSRSQQGEEKTTNSVTFAVDDTREFTRALRAKAEQAVRKEARKAQATSQKGEAPKKETKSANVAETQQEPEDMGNDEEDMMELAKDVEEDTVETGGFDGTTTTAVPIGRGLANALSMLRHTGEITGKHAGKEELRGRAKDERTYEDYEALDLKKVVKIGRGATKKDLEFANKEIKLEYRDKHGRLLTRKDAYRELCYQFHGHGSSAKNEERKLRQIERERAEQRLASRQVAQASGTGTEGAGTLGALKATQKATGKAFVVHKT